MGFPPVQEMLFQGLGGLGLFLLGLHFLSEGVRALAASRMRRLMEQLAGTRLSGLLTGIFVTSLLQSGTAVAVLVVGFVNSGILTLGQAASLIVGINIGAASTAVLIALPVMHYGLPALGVAALVFLFSRRDRVRYAAMAVMGLGLLFFGLEQLTAAFRPVRDMPALLAALAAFSTGNLVGILTCILVGAVVTAILHSASATIGILMGLGAAGVIDWQMALAMVVGAKIGTTMPAVIASIGLSADARRAAYAHLGFNLIGAALACLLFSLYAEWVALLVGRDPAIAVYRDGHPSYPLVPVAIAVFAVSFNVVNAMVLLPWQPLLLRGLSRLGGETNFAQDLAAPRYLFGKALREPELAVSLLGREQRRFEGALASLLDPICRPERRGLGPSQKRQSALAALGKEIEEFGHALCRQDLSPQTAARLMRQLQVQEETAALAERLTSLAQTFENRELTGQARTLAAQWVEALDALLGETVEALSERDIEHVALLAEVTAEGGPSLERLRQRYLEDSERFTLRERQLLLAVLGQIEGSFWLLHRLCRGGGGLGEAEAPKAAEPAGQRGLAAASR